MTRLLATSNGKDFLNEPRALLETAFCIFNMQALKFSYNVLSCVLSVSRSVLKLASKFSFIWLIIVDDQPAARSLGTPNNYYI